MSAHPLAPILDTAAAAPLLAELTGRIDRHEAIALDGTGVARVGLACLQALASARAMAADRGLDFVVTAPSAALREMAALARLDIVLDRVG